MAEHPNVARIRDGYAAFLFRSTSQRARRRRGSYCWHDSTRLTVMGTPLRRYRTRGLPGELTASGPSARATPALTAGTGPRRRCRVLQPEPDLSGPRRRVRGDQVSHRRRGAPGARGLTASLPRRHPAPAASSADLVQNLWPVHDSPGPAGLLWGWYVVGMVARCGTALRRTWWWSSICCSSASW
jgi:hypothetical protein